MLKRYSSFQVLFILNIDQSYPLCEHPAPSKPTVILKECRAGKMFSKQTQNRQRLTSLDYWNDMHAGTDKAELDSSDVQQKSLTKSLAKRFKFLSKYFRSSIYTDFLIYDVALGSHLPFNSDWKMLEVGSAPGNQLLRFHKKFGYQPYGVEYTPTGVEKNRQLFLDNGHNPDQVIQADFFSKEFQEAHKDNYDVVFSLGFIEHFEDVKTVIANHVDLIKPGGVLVIEIPNLSGINYALSSFFHPESLAVHNLDIMEKKKFQQLFEGHGLEHLFCDQIGMFSLGLQNAKPGSWKQVMIPVLHAVNACIGLGCKLVFNRHRLESQYTSPYFLYIGRKAEAISEKVCQPTLQKVSA